MPRQETAWKPDDSFHDIIDGEFKGVLRVKKVLAGLGVTFGKEIITSRDDVIVKAKEKLYRDTMPPGFEQWQMPVLLGGGNRPVMPFITVGSPNAKVPEHTHRNDALLRLVISGSIIYQQRELIPGDWMYIPAKFKYSFRAGPLGCVVMHMYNGV